MLKRKGDAGSPLEEEEKQSGSSGSSDDSSQPAHKKQRAGAAADKPAELSAAEEGAAIERRKKISVATARLLSQLTLPSIRDFSRLTRFTIAWSDIDVNVVDSGGQWVPAALLTAMRRLHSNCDNIFNNTSAFNEEDLIGGPKSCASQDAIIAALLRYEKPADQPALTIHLPITSYCALLPDVESVQPRDANHLLFLFACELVTRCDESEMCSFVNRLVRTLVQRGFDLDTRDAHGNSLLSIAAIASIFNSNAEPAFRMLVDLGADPCRWRDSEGHNLMRVCSDFIAARLHGLDLWEFEPDGLLKTLRRVVRMLASFGVDTVDNPKTGEAYWQRLARTLRDPPPHDDNPELDHNIPSLVAETVLLELLAVHAQDPSAFPVRSRHASLLLHYALTSHPSRPRLPAASKLVNMVEGKGPWGRHAITLDIHVRDDQDRTLKQLIETVLGREESPDLRFILAQLDELQRQWMQNERPFVRRQLDEQTDLPPELCDLAMSFVDGLNHKGEREVDAEQAAASDEEGGVADGEAAANGEQPVAGL